MSTGGITLCLSCGLPASGKTTYWRRLPEFLESCDLQTTALLIIEYDKVIPHDWLFTKDVHPERAQSSEQIEEENKSWKSFRCQVVAVVEYLIHTLQLHGKSGLQQISKPDGVTSDIWKNMLPCILSIGSRWHESQGSLIIVIDDNMYFRSMRNEYFKLARKYQTGFCQVFFHCPTSEAIRRNEERQEQHQVPESVILRMADKLEPPDRENYTWEQSSIVVAAELENQFTSHNNPIVKLLMSSLSNPVQAQSFSNEGELIQSQVQNSTNLLHQGDLILRKCVAAWMTQRKKSGPTRELQSRAKEALKAKEMILTRLKEDPFSFGVLDEWTIELSSNDPASDYYKFISEVFYQSLCHPPR